MNKFYLFGLLLLANVFFTKESIGSIENINKIDSLDKEVQLYAFSLLNDGDFGKIQDLVMSYIYKTNDNQDLDFILIIDEILFSIKKNYIRDDYFNVNNPLGSMNAVPPRIDGKDVLYAGMSLSHPNLTEKERIAYKILIEKRKKYHTEMQTYLEAKRRYESILFYMNRYIEKGILGNKINVKALLLLKCKYDVQKINSKNTLNFEVVEKVYNSK